MEDNTIINLSENQDLTSNLNNGNSTSKKKSKFDFNKICQNCLRFVSKEWLYFAAPILIFSLFFGVLYSMNIFPFGTDNMSNYDLLAQIVPFYEHFYDVLDGKSSLFYSPAIAGGADVFGTLAYCAVSPFTFLFLLFGRTSVYNAVSFILPLKLSAVACCAIYLLKKEFKNISEYSMLIMSIAYAFCGYMFVANTYINWVDFLIYMPFVVIGFKKLVTEKKILYFAISYALMIYACFSIACFALFVLFIIFVAYVLIVEEKQTRWLLLSKMCYALVLAIALSLPLLVPSLFAYLRSGRNTGLFENMGNELTSDHLYPKLTYILTDSVFLFLTIVYYIKNRFKTKIDAFLFVAGVIMMFPVLIDEVCNLMNAGSYMSYALRFGFLNSTFAFYMAARLLNNAKEKPIKKWVNYTFTSVFLVLAVLVVAFILNLNNMILTSDGTENATIADFSAVFAHSCGGLEVMYQIALVIFALVAVAVLLYHFRLSSLKYLSFIMLGVMAVQIAFLNIHLVKGNSFNPLRFDQYNAIFNVVDDYDDRRYYRVKDNNSSISNDAALNTHTNSYCVFSSVIDNDNFLATNLFNYDGNQTNSVEGSGGTFFGDCLLGYKYFYVHIDDTRTQYSLANREYAVKLTETAQPNFCAYENTAVFPNCYTVSSGELKMDSGDYCDDLNELYKFIGGQGNLFVDVSYDEELVDNKYVDTNVNSIEVITDPKTQEVIYSFKLNTSYYGNYYFDTDFSSEYEIGYSTSTSDDKINLDYSQKLVDVVKFGYNSSGSGLYNLSFKSIGGKPLDLETVKKSVVGKIIPNDKIIELSSYLKTRECEYTQSRNTFTINANASDGETYLLLNYVSIEGFSATVNGKKAEVIDNGIKFLLVKLEEGENTVVFKYNSPYFVYIAIGIVLSAIILTALYLVLKKFNKIEVAIRPYVCVAALVVAVGVLAFFYCYPTGLFVTKLFKILIAL